MGTTGICLAAGLSIPQPWRSALPLLLLVIFFAWVVWMGKLRGKTNKPREKGMSSADLTGRDRLQKAMEQLQINVMEFGRDVEARLDTKIRTLEQLIRDADERIKRLQELEGPGAPDGGGTQALHREIYLLADQGIDSIEIARRTGAAPGEVELILGLRKTRNT
jgi:hypothetical protein